MNPTTNQPDHNPTISRRATLLCRHLVADYVGAAPPYADIQSDAYYAVPITSLTDRPMSGLDNRVAGEGDHCG